MTDTYSVRKIDPETVEYPLDAAAYIMCAAYNASGEEPAYAIVVLAMALGMACHLSRFDLAGGQGLLDEAMDMGAAYAHYYAHYIIEPAMAGDAQKH